MKAFKIYNIDWNLSSVKEEDRENVLKSLPKVKGFYAKDSFNVVHQTNAFLKKRYGFMADSFYYNEYRVVETLEKLLRLGAPSDEKEKCLFTPTGKLTSYGMSCYENLILNLKNLKNLNSNNVPEEKIPVIYDECMIGVEKVLDLKWEETTIEEITLEIDIKLDEYRNQYAQSRASRSAAKKEANKDE